MTTHSPALTTVAGSATSVDTDALTGARSAWMRIGPLLTDAIALLGVSLAFSAVRFGSEGGAIDIGVDVVDYNTFAVLVTVIWFVVLQTVTGRDVIGMSGSRTYRSAFIASTIMFFGTALFALVLHSEVSRAFVLFVFPVGTILVLAGRFAWEVRFAYLVRVGRLASSVLVVGSFDVASRLAAELTTHPDRGLRVAAVVSFGDSVSAPGSPVHRASSGEEVAALASVAGASLVVVTDTHPGDPTFLRDLAWSLETSGIRLAVSSRVGLVSASRFSVATLAGLPLVWIGFTRLSFGRNLLKRCFDVVASGLALIVLAPLLVAIAVIVRVDSAGPALFLQERVGRDGQPFTMWKFRSMRIDAAAQLPRLQTKNENDGLLFKMKEDPRVTRVGRTLRRTSLDELPQLINVFCGQMSLVGPRPALPSEVARYTPEAQRRLLMRPGLTGVWQVSGRSDLPWVEGLSLDLAYVENWSFLSDLLIILRTVAVVAAKKGAY